MRLKPREARRVPQYLFLKDKPLKSGNSLSSPEIYVFIPLKAAAAIPVPVRASVLANDCGFGDGVDTPSLGARADRFGANCVVASG